MEALRAAAAQITNARSVVAFTGAGISAESGVPTFRDALTGLWARFQPEDLATPEAFQRDPALVWNWYAWRRELVRKAQPNAGHLALVALELRVPQFCLITQNVDGLHARAGSRKVLTLHGDLFANIREGDHAPVSDIDLTDDVPPRCKQTHQRVRPGVVWFGEHLSPDMLEQSFQASRECDVFLSIGTSTVVEPAAFLPFTALQAGAHVIEVNPDDTPLTAHSAYSLKGPAAQLLPQLMEAAFPNYPS